MNKKKKILILVSIVFIVTGITLYFVYINKDNNVKYYTKEEVKMLLEKISFENIAENRYTYEEQILFYQFETLKIALS